MTSASVALGVTALVVGSVSVLGVWFVRGQIDSVEDYISARDSAGTGTLTATLIASSMGAWILLSPAEAGAAFGGVTAVLGYAVGSALPMVLYAVVGPRIRQLIPNGHTLTEYTYARFGRAMYGYVLLVSIGYMFMFLAAEMTGITEALQRVAGVPMWQTALLIGVFVLTYTTYGGLRASIFTDTVQALVILPLLAVSFGVALLELGGTDAVYESVTASNPQLLDLGFASGVESGVYIAVSVLGAEMLNQAWWQRVYAAENERVLRRSFLVTAVAVVPMIFVAGLFGLAAKGLGLVGDASIAFFLVTTEVFPDAVVLGIVILAVLLVMSSADTLFNALSSIVTADLPRIFDPGEKTLTISARALTVVVALASIVIGAQGYSVLTLFFVADLLAVATFIPLLAGLYARRLSGHSALLASLAGLLVGTLFFPSARPLLSATGLSLPAASYFRSFLGAAIVSGAITALAAVVGQVRIDFDQLDRSITRLDQGTDDGGNGR